MSVEQSKISQLAGQIAAKVDDNQRLWDAALEQSSTLERQYAEGQQQLRVLVAQFNVLAQQVAQDARTTTTVQHPLTNSPEDSMPAENS